MQGTNRNPKSHIRNQNTNNWVLGLFNKILIFVAR